MRTDINKHAKLSNKSDAYGFDQNATPSSLTILKLRNFTQKKRNQKKKPKQTTACLNVKQS